MNQQKTQCVTQLNGVEMWPESTRRQPKNSSEQGTKTQKRLFTIAEAAEYLGRSEWAVRHLIWRGKLSHIRHGRRIHVDIQDMEAFIDRNRIAA